MNLVAIKLQDLGIDYSPKSIVSVNPIDYSPKSIVSVNPTSIGLFCLRNQEELFLVL